MGVEICRGSIPPPWRCARARWVKVETMEGQTSFFGGGILLELGEAKKLGRAKHLGRPSSWAGPNSNKSWTCRQERGGGRPMGSAGGALSKEAQKFTIFCAFSIEGAG